MNLYEVTLWSGFQKGWRVPLYSTCTSAPWAKSRTSRDRILLCSSIHVLRINRILGVRFDLGMFGVEGIALLVFISAIIIA
jgi:hypothetical protein